MTTLAGKTRIISNWQPSRLHETVITREFGQELERLLGFDLTNSRYHWSYGVWQTQPQVEPYFHHDGSGVMPTHLLVWSNVFPTEIQYVKSKTKTKTKTLLTRHGDIILINNFEVKHSAPYFPKGTKRWFARLWL